MNNVLYQSERLTQFKIADLQQQAVHAEQVRLARSSDPGRYRKLLWRVGATFSELMHRPRPTLRIDAPVVSADPLCVPGTDC